MSVDDFLFSPVGEDASKTQRIDEPLGLAIPESWVRVLNAIRREPSWMCSTIAGGALRDFDNGRPVKDVDIFVPHLGNNETALLQLQHAVPNCYVMEVEHNVHNTSQVGAEGISHFHFEVDGWKFEISQVVKQFDHQTLLESFDIGICMISLQPIATAPYYKVLRMPDYNTDKWNKHIRVVQQTGGREIEHAERIRSKYTDWTIVPL